MSKNEFFNQLLNQLNELNEKEKEQVREYYNEMICDGLELGREEENIIAGFGDPKEVAKKIKKEHQQYNQYIQSEPSSYQSSDYVASKPVHTVVVEAQNLRIDVRPVSSGPVRVLFQARESLDQILFTEEGGEFLFRHSMRNFFLWFNWFRMPPRIILELPVEFDGNLRVKTSNAALCLSGLRHLSNGQFLSSNAHIEVNNINCKSLLIQSSNGSLDINNIAGDQLEAVTSNARIIAHNCEYPNALLLSTKNSGIDVRNLKSDKLVLKTCNAGIKGTVIGDIREYAVQSHTSNASNNLPNYSFPGQTKHFVARTSNGRIKVEFVN